MFVRKNGVLDLPKKVNTIKVRRFLERFRETESIVAVKGCDSREKAGDEVVKIMKKRNFTTILQFVRKSKDSYVYAIINGSPQS